MLSWTTCRVAAEDTTAADINAVASATMTRGRTSTTRCMPTKVAITIAAMVVVVEITNTVVEASTMAVEAVEVVDTNNSHAVVSVATEAVEAVEWVVTAVPMVVITAVRTANLAILLISTMRTNQSRTMRAAGSALCLVLRQPLAVLPLVTW